MTSETRRAVAYIAGRLITGKQASSIFDYDEGDYVNISGKIGAANVNVYDYDAGCHVSGPLANLYHHGASAHLQLEIAGKKFKGYDYGSSSHFEGTVSGTSISLYDFGEGEYFSFSI